MYISLVFFLLAQLTCLQGRPSSTEGRGSTNPLIFLDGTKSAVEEKVYPALPSLVQAHPKFLMQTDDVSRISGVTEDISPSLSELGKMELRDIKPSAEPDLVATTASEVAGKFGRQEDSANQRNISGGSDKEKQKTLVSSVVGVPIENEVFSESKGSLEDYNNKNHDTHVENDNDYEIGRSSILGPGPSVGVIAAGIGIALYVYGRTWRYVIPGVFAWTSTPPPITTATPSAVSSRGMYDPWPSYDDLPESTIPRPDLDQIIFRHPDAYVKETYTTDNEHPFMAQGTTSKQSSRGSFSFFSGLLR